MAVLITWGMCALPLSWQTLRRSRQALAARDECPFEIAILKPSHVWKSQKRLCLQITWHSVSEASDSKRIHFTLTQHAPCLHQLHWQTHRYLRTDAHRSHWQDHVIFNPSYYAFGHFSRQGGSGICFSECHVPVSGAARERNESSKQSSTQVSTLTRIAPQRLLVHALSTIKYMKVVVSSINLSIPSWDAVFELRTVALEPRPWRPWRPPSLCAWWLRRWALQRNFCHRARRMCLSKGRDEQMSREGFGMFEQDCMCILRIYIYHTISLWFNNV